MWVRRLVLGGVAGMLMACAQKGPAPMYMWEAFPRQQYNTLLREVSTPEEQIRALEAHAEKARGASAALPPGFRAHLGMLHLSSGNAEQARRLWEAEKATFPESAPYMDQLLKRLETSSKPVKKTESPA